jgi:hypothetical protein
MAPSDTIPVLLRFTVLGRSLAYPTVVCRTRITLRNVHKFTGLRKLRATLLCLIPQSFTLKLYQYIKRCPQSTHSNEKLTEKRTERKLTEYSKVREGGRSRLTRVGEAKLIIIHYYRSEEGQI